MQFAEKDTLNLFLAWYNASKVEWEKQHTGSKHDIVMTWVGEDIPGHSRTL
jgi:hypothetical protein